MTDHSTVQDEELVATLFDLGREVSAVLDVDELLKRIPGLIARLTSFTVFSVYMLDERRQELRIAYAEGYPADLVMNFRLKVGQGVVGAAVAEQRPILLNNVHEDPRYVGLVSGVNSQLAVPLRHQNRVLGALNLLSDKIGAFTERDEQILAQFGVHVAQALANARMFEQQRAYTAALATLTEIAREVAEILDLDELLGRIAILTKRIIDYRTFGILLVNEEKHELEPKVALQYGERTSMLNIKIGEGLVGYSALHKVPLIVDDVSKDPRYIKVLDDVRSELVIPLMSKDRCIGVFDLESPELNAFNQRHAEILGILASQAAVAIENARLYETVRASELRLEREIEFARRVQTALMPVEAPKKPKGIDLAARFEPARQIGGDLYDFLTPDPSTLVLAVGDVSGKGVPAALYGAFAGELVRSRTFRRRFTNLRSSPSGVLASMNAILHERRLEEYFCTLCYASFDFKKRQLVIANSGLPYPIRRSDGTSQPIQLPGVPLGAFPNTTYEELTFDLKAGDLYVFCTDGIYEAEDHFDREFGASRLMKVIDRLANQPAQAIVDGIFEAVEGFRRDGPAADDMTAVALRITT
ncbi:MAG TPA: SpoIIE family protein phosphatase [Vicinamibacterales bacterium]|nr:SpoIIE family protein phosphatase [Vicinamibacterales bacterium]